MIRPKQLLWTFQMFSSERQRQRKVNIQHGTLVLDLKYSQRGGSSRLLCAGAAEACSWEVSFKDWSKNRRMSWNAPISSHLPRWPCSNAAAPYISHFLPFALCLLACGSRSSARAVRKTAQHAQIRCTEPTAETRPFLKMGLFKIFRELFNIVLLYSSTFVVTGKRREDL